MSVSEGLKALVGHFYRDIELARVMVSPNIEDTLAIKAAIVGFSYHAPTEQWSHNHYAFVRTRLDENYPKEELAEYGDNAANVRLFYALCLGFALGQYSVGELTDHDVELLEVQIP